MVPGVKAVGGSIGSTAATGTGGTTGTAGSTGIGGIVPISTAIAGLPTCALNPRGILQGTGLLNRSATAAAHARNLAKNSHYAGSTATTALSGMASDNFLYFYHPDHLGSSGYVSDGAGQLYEHVEYFPFGETWVQEASSTQRTPYLFTGKELDEETGLYYFGARYYDPRTSVWQSPGPILEKYLPTAAHHEDDAVKLSLPTAQYPQTHFNLPSLGGVFSPKPQILNQISL
jgi:RHS repeat-associated protein